MKSLALKKKFKNKNTLCVQNFTIKLFTSQNGKPYLSISAEENSIGLPLTESNAKQLHKWLNEYLYPYDPGNG